MLTLIPSHAITGVLGGYPAPHTMDADWFCLYEHFGKQVREWNSRDNVCEVLNATSSVNNSDLAPLLSPAAARTNLAQLFAHAGDTGLSGEFLRHCGINSWADLATPIQVTGWRSKLFADAKWFDLAGRRFRRSPNRFHPKARFTANGGLRFEIYLGRWVYRIGYGYAHDPGWTEGLEQAAGESREKFAGRVNQWMNDRLTPESSPHDRRWRERVWSRRYEELIGLFESLGLNFPAELADVIVAKGGRIGLTESRIRTLTRWAKEAKL